jgi:hypothetical protein
MIVGRHKLNKDALVSAIVQAYDMQEVTAEEVTAEEVTAEEVTYQACDINSKAWYVAANYEDEVKSDYWFNWQNAFDSAVQKMKSIMKPVTQQPVKRQPEKVGLVVLVAAIIMIDLLVKICEMIMQFHINNHSKYADSFKTMLKPLTKKNHKPSGFKLALG